MRVSNRWVVLAWLGSAPVMGAEHLVALGDDCANRCFTPSTSTVRVGDSVTFYPYDSNFFTGPRNVVADDGSFRCARGCDGKGGDGTPSEPPWQFTLTFRSPGTVAFHDEVSGVKGTIVVLPAEGPPAGPRAIEYIRGSPFGAPAPYVPSYFLTTNPDEIDALDVGGEWLRTGQAFDVWPAATAGALPTCRFLDTVHGAHFYTHHAAECAALRADPRWIDEGNAFLLKPIEADGSCAPGASPLFRHFNNGTQRPPHYPPPRPNALLHRYTVSPSEFQLMQNAGWTAEGDARTLAFACVPAIPAD